jgi:hypothetical protein
MIGDSDRVKRLFGWAWYILIAGGLSLFTGSFKGKLREDYLVSFEIMEQDILDLR